LRQGW
jgi:hypothetical protein